MRNNSNYYESQALRLLDEAAQTLKEGDRYSYNSAMLLVESAKVTAQLATASAIIEGTGIIR